jgi:hypothetical protein
MTPAEPTFSLESFPEGTKRVVYAAQQPEYQALKTYAQPDGTLLTCWMPDEGEIEAIMRGEPVVIELMTFNQPLQPMKVWVPSSEQ